jgi:hypothetical protein
VRNVVYAATDAQYIGRYEDIRSDDTHYPVSRRLDLSRFIATPNDDHYVPVAGPTVVRDKYFVVAGGEDRDLGMLQGYATFTRAYPINLSKPAECAKGFKALCFVGGAVPNWFNSLWKQDSHTLPTMESVH